MEQKKIKRTILLICLLCFTMSITVFAKDPYLSYRSQSGNVNVKYSTSHSTKWINIFKNSIAAWNSSGANVKITVTNNTKNLIQASPYKDSWLGVTISSVNSQRYTTKFRIKMNTRTINKAKPTNYSNYSRSTLVHEFGHVFGLCDNPRTSSPSIMKYNRNRNTMIKPQSFDIKNVNAIYKK